MQNKDKEQDTEITIVEIENTNENIEQEIDSTTILKTEVEVVEEEIEIKEEPETILNPDQKEMTRILQSNSISIPDLEKGYYLVTNVFSKHRNTVNWVAFLKEKGYSPKVFTNPKNNWEYVYVTNDEDIKFVYNKYKEIYKLSYFKDIWIFRINLP